MRCSMEGSKEETVNFYITFKCFSRQSCDLLLHTRGIVWSGLMRSL